MIIMLLDFLFSLVGVLLSVAFFTLMERKIMGLMHFRKGPNKVLFMGVSQPISDALKLLTKELPKLSFFKVWMFFLGPGTMIFLMMLCWGWYDYSFNMSSNSMKILLILSVMSISVYGFILTSWGSNSGYSIMGGYRAIAQVISYEVCLILYILVIVYMAKSFSFSMISVMQNKLWTMLMVMPIFLSWLMLCMAETNRTPFDMAEGESEIVSGFNIEYGGGLFALIFISEYGMVIFLSFLSVIMFSSVNFMLMKTFLMCLLFVWVRCCFPRMRYDSLMMMSWKMALPYSVSMISLSLCV